MNITCLYGKNIKYKDLIKAINVDKDVFKKDYTMNIFKGFIWAYKSKIGYAILKKENEVIGYASVISLKNKGYEYILDGSKPDVDIKSSYIVNLKRKNIKHNLYISAIAIKKKYQDTSNLFRLLECFFTNIENMKHEGLVIDKVIADVISTQGEKLMKIFDGKFIKETKLSSKLFSLDSNCSIKILAHINNNK